MHFLPTVDQHDLAAGVRAQLTSTFPLARLADGFDAAVWKGLADTGVFTLTADLGLGLVEAVLVFEELGRAAVPGPLVATFLTATFLPETDRPSGADSGPVALLEVPADPLLVAHLDVAGSLLVLHRDRAVLTDIPTGISVPDPLDPLSPLTRLEAAPDAGVEIVDGVGVHRTGALLTAALQVGLAARMTELAVTYAGQRQQFGRPIGSFQAVQHLCADMLVRVELARAAVHAAACAVDQLPDTADRAVAGAKLLADEAATVNARSCVQVHGGMGFTWEMPVHYLLKRAWLHATEFGTADDHAEALAQLL